MDDWGKFFEEMFYGLIKLIMDLICGVCKGVFYGFKKLRNKKFLIGALINLLPPIYPLYKGFSIIDFLKINNTTKISTPLLDYSIFFIISFIFYLNIISGLGGNKKLSAALETAGIVGQDGKPPRLISKNKDKTGYEIYRFRGLVKFSDWKRKKESIETSLNISIKEIEEGERKDEVILKTIPGVLVMPGGSEKEILYWNDNFIKEKDSLVSIGRNEVEEIVVDFDVDPHWLVGGSTGSGKSVLIRAMAWQFIARGHKCYFVDFKGGIEFSNGYKRYGETIIDRAKLLDLLKALKRENKLRQDALVEIGAKNINDYNKKSSKKMYRVILIIDELAEVIDISSVPSEEKEITEDISGRLASFVRVARATGIHIIFGIQRPDANVVNGQIRSNVTGRICGRVPSGKASEIVLDDPIAANLPKVKGRMYLGNGDEKILFQSYYFDDDKDLRKVKVPGDRLLIGGDIGRDDGEDLFTTERIKDKQKKSKFKNRLIQKFKRKTEDKSTKKIEVFDNDVFIEETSNEIKIPKINDKIIEKKEDNKNIENNQLDISSQIDEYTN